MLQSLGNKAIVEDVKEVNFENSHLRQTEEVNLSPPDMMSMTDAMLETYNCTVTVSKIVKKNTEKAEDNKAKKDNWQRKETKTK